MAGLAVGSMMSRQQAQQQATQSGCTMNQMVVNGMTYVQCGSTWYQPVYQNGQVAYQVVNPPR
jgi:hypothetical protein